MKNSCILLSTSFTILAQCMNNDGTISRDIKYPIPLIYFMNKDGWIIKGFGITYQL